jgi:L-alanine-DL-glutamate epimerase-like enolase superfamily enzyme
MKITGVEVLTIPDRGDSMMLVAVDTDAGIHGLGEVGIRTRQEAARGALRHLGDLLVGQDATRIEHLWQLMSRSGFLAPCGISATCSWDRTPPASNTCGS